MRFLQRFNLRHATQLLACLFLTALTCKPAIADTVYTYTGNNFTTFTVPFNSSDSVYGSLSLAAPLGANLDQAFVTPEHFSFSDGYQTITDANSFGTFSFSTDGSGNITQWVIGILDNSLTSQIVTVKTNALIHDEGYYYYDSHFDSYTGNVESDPGLWSSPNSSPVPEPTSLALLGTGVLGAFRTLRRRLR